MRIILITLVKKSNKIIKLMLRGYLWAKTLVYLSSHIVKALSNKRLI